MQIGNRDLDKVCEEVIVPALKSCDLDPKRVDKHNEGGLLKSEIVEFIESSDIIIADLTNERPNCYLEIGYVMGLDKFRNLILTAQEDHNQNRPNYKRGGPKIHFDLSGYDILFWDPNKLDRFKEELEKRIRHRLAILESYLPTHVSPWDEKWISEHQKRAFDRLQKVGYSGFMEICMTLRDHKINIAQNDLLRIAEKAQIHTFGSPLGMVLRSEETRPRPKTDGIVAEILDDYSLNYWTLRKDGTFYLLKSLFEDERRPGHVFFDTRIVRITEALFYSARLYFGFNVAPNSHILIRIRHGGLKDRFLRATSWWGHPPERRSTEDEVYTEVDVTLQEIESDLVDLVRRFTEPLFVVFDFYEVEREELEDIVNDFVAGRITRKSYLIR